MSGVACLPVRERGYAGGMQRFGLRHLPGRGTIANGSPVEGACGPWLNPAIHVENLHYSYGDVEAVKGVSVDGCAEHAGREQNGRGALEPRNGARRGRAPVGPGSPTVLPRNRW